MAEQKKRPLPDVYPGVSSEVAEFAGNRWWTVLSGSDLPYPVTVSLAIGSGGRLRCTGLIIGMPAASDGTETIEVTSASLRNIRISELLAAITTAQDALSSGRTVTAGQLAELTGPGCNPHTGRPWRDDFESTDGGKTYRLPTVMSYSGPGKGRPLLDRLFAGMTPDLPPAGPQIRGQALKRDHFEWVAGEYRRALDVSERAPMKELIRRLSENKGRPIPEPTARRWVQRARDLGILGPSRSGVAGEYPADS